MAAPVPFRPVLLPDHPTVAELEDWLAAHDVNPWHVEGTYYATPGDADRARRATAERMARSLATGRSLARLLTASEARTLWTQGQRTCPWCERAVSLSDDVEPVGGRLLHRDCYEAFTEWAASPSADDWRAEEDAAAAADARRYADEEAQDIRYFAEEE